MVANIFIAGSGGIGKAVGLIMATAEDMDCNIYFGDISQETLDAAHDFVEHGAGRPVIVHTVLMPKEGSNEAMNNALQQCEVILDCLPGKLAPKMARLAKEYKCHYANLTEYVAETNEIMEIGKDADTAFVLQTGLAPGFINILACKLYDEFKTDFGSDKLDTMTMKVGAISKHASAPYYYAFTWSPIGVATEYLKDAVVVRNYETIKVPALSELNEIVIDGNIYVDNFTSGGAADLPQAFAGKIKNLDYKTIRYPGHYKWVQKQLETIPDDDQRIATLEKIMVDQIPRVEDDTVVIYSSVTGRDTSGILRQKEYAYEIHPSYVGNQKLRAIQTTTAAPLCEIARMMLTKGWKGVKLQSQIDPQEFLNGPFVKSIYGTYEKK